MVALAQSYIHRSSFTGAAADVRGPLHQVLCGSVNIVNVTHPVENYTSSAPEFLAYMVLLINLDLVMAV